MKVPDRGLWLLQHYGVKVTEKEYIGIKLTDGLFDDANKSYLMTYNPDFSLKSHMPHILHQADMMAARIEFEIEWLPKFSKDSVATTKKSFTLSTNKKSSSKSKALNTVASPGLKNMLDSL